MESAMTAKLVTEAGYYNGKFLSPGMSYVDGEAADTVAAADLSSLNKDDLIAEAKRLGVDVNPSQTKAEIIAAIQAGSK
jgi:hypothetical protein